MERPPVAAADNTSLWYELRILQQPLVARAAGGGPSASNDRRPMDPPPILQLKIFQGYTRELARDTTATYCAEFFAFVSIAHTRPHRKNVRNGDLPSPSLLGEVVVSSEPFYRPEPAYYFAFTDLSVTYPGQYFLIFDVYERPGIQLGHTPAGGRPSDAGDSFFIHRQSTSSAEQAALIPKKFSGFSSSTELGITLAQQGCRIRNRKHSRTASKARHPQPIASPGSTNTTAVTLPRLRDVIAEINCWQLDQMKVIGGHLRPLLPGLDRNRLSGGQPIVSAVQRLQE